MNRREIRTTIERDDVIAQRDALAAKVETLIAEIERMRSRASVLQGLVDKLTPANERANAHADSLASLVRTMIAEAHAHRDGVRTDRATTAALASERLWDAADEAEERLIEIAAEQVPDKLHADGWRAAVKAWCKLGPEHRAAAIAGKLGALADGLRSGNRPTNAAVPIVTAYRDAVAKANKAAKKARR